MSECPELSALERDATAAVREHVAACASCRLVVELLEERRRGVEARDLRDECAKFEMLLAARNEGTIGGTAGALLDAHLRECADCQAVAATLPPADERRKHSSLPPVSTAAYALGREVARGGMGRILEALDVRIGRPVAVKELLGKAPALAARFEREARVTARLQHPGIVPIYEIGKWPDGTPFYSMRMVEGRTLREAVRDRKTLDERLALVPAIIAAAEAVAFAHARGVIHRDLTPNNVLVGAHGDTVVIDWGLAKDLDEASEEQPASPYRGEAGASGQLTSAGAVIGTAAYMPPEQANGESVDQRADVYALGAILYHVLVGEPPYRASASEDLVRQVRSGPPPRVRELATGTPLDLASVVDKAMARDPEARYASAGELVEELRRFQTGRLVEAHHYSRRERWTRWVRAHRARVLATFTAMVVLAIAGSLGLAGVLRERDRAEHERAVADAAKTKAQQENVRLMEEQGRQELLAGNTTRALAWLNEAYKSGDTSPELRFMLGTAMRRVESVVRELDCRVPDGNDTPGIAFSPDGTLGLAACGSAVGIARVSDWTIVRTIETRTQGAVWSHDGRHIANKDGGVLSVWDVATGARVFTTKAHGGAIRSVMFTPDDRLVITTGDDRMARMWDAATGAAVRAIEVGTAQMNVVRGQLTPDGKTLVTVTGDGAVKEWEVATGAAIRGFQLGVQSFGKGSLSPDGARLATCHVDGTVRISDLASGRVVSTFAAHATAALECQFSPNGRWLVTTGADGAARVWDIEHGQLVSSLDQLGVFSRAVVSPDGERVATLGSDGIVRMWHAATGSLLGSFDDPSGMSGGLLFSPDGHVLVVPRENSSILVIRDLDAGMQPVAIPPGTIAISGSLLHASGDRLAVRAQDGEVTIIDTATSAPVSHEPLREPIAWSMDGRRLAGVAKDGVVVLDGRDGHAIARIAVRSPDAVALDEHGRRLLVAMAHSQIWDVEHARVELDLGGRSDGGSLSPDGAVALSWRDRRHVEVWNVDQRQIQSRIALDDDVMGAVGYAADRRHVLLAVADARTMVFPIPNAGRIGGYDLATGARGYELPRAFLTFLAPDRRRVVAAGIGRDLEIRETSDGSLVSRIASGSEPTIAGTLVRDGTLLLALTLRHIDVRSAVDGRLLARMNAELQAEVTQDSYHVGGAFDLADAGRAAVSLGAHPWIWHLPSEQRPPDVVDKIVRQRVLWRVFDGGLVAVEATLHGRVLRHGHPVPGATVTVEHIGSLSWPHVLSAADGRYAFDHMPLGRIEVSAMAPDGSAHGLSRVALDRDDVIADIELDQEATISGVVVDESGAPVPGVLVTAKGTFLDGKSDAAGRFTIHALRPGKFDVAVAESDAHVGVARVTVELKSKTDAVTGVQLVVRSLR